MSESRANLIRFISKGICILLAIGLFAILVNNTPGITWDDALITLVYADNLADEGDFFYNQDDSTPVDGFTSMLDVLVKAMAIDVLPYSTLDTAMVVTAGYGLFLVLVCICIVLYLSKNLPNYGLPLALMSIIMIGSSPELVDATVTGLEAPLFVALALLAIFFQPSLSRPLIWHLTWALLLVMVLLARPEGMVVVLMASASYLWSAYRTDKQWRAVSVIGLVGILAGAYFIWRIFKFGYWAPNTYYAKASASRVAEILDGLKFLSLYAERSTFNTVKLVTLLLSPILLLPSLWNNDEARWRFAIVVAFALALTAGVVAAGGDSYLGSGRLLALPLTLLMFMPLLLISGARTRGQLIAMAVLGFLVFGNLWHSYKTIKRAPKTTLVTNANAWLKCRAQATERLGTILNGLPVSQTDAQFIKFFDRSRKVIDLHGLNNREIAHIIEPGHVTFGKYSQELGISVRSEIYIYGYHLFTEEPMASYTLSEIFDDPELMIKYVGYHGPGEGSYPSPPRELPTDEQMETLSELYLPVSIHLDSCDPNSNYFNFLLRRDMLSALQTYNWVIVNTN